MQSLDTPNKIKELLNRATGPAPVGYEIPRWLRDWLCKEPCPDCNHCRKHKNDTTKMGWLFKQIHTLSIKFPKATHPQVYRVLETLYVRLKLNEQDYVADYLNTRAGAIFRAVEKRRMNEDTPYVEKTVAQKEATLESLRHRTSNFSNAQLDETVMRAIWADYWSKNPAPKPVDVTPLFYVPPKPVQLPSSWPLGTEEETYRPQKRKYTRRKKK